MWEYLNKLKQTVNGFWNFGSVKVKAKYEIQRWKIATTTRASLIRTVACRSSVILTSLAVQLSFNLRSRRDETRHHRDADNKRQLLPGCHVMVTLVSGNWKEKTFKTVFAHVLALISELRESWYYQISRCDPQSCLYDVF